MAEQFSLETQHTQYIPWPGKGSTWGWAMSIRLQDVSKKQSYKVATSVSGIISLDLNHTLKGDEILPIGAHTAISPYTQERYFENHKLMSAVDKLHKLYSSTFEPAVWARSVGLEVLNELDSVKTAIMMDAGANSRRRNVAGGAMGWNMAGKGVEGLASGANAAKIIGRGIVGVAGAALQNILRTVETPDQQK
jgi:hypothetical protein